MVATLPRLDITIALPDKRGHLSPVRRRLMLLMLAPYLSGRGEVNSIHYPRPAGEAALNGAARPRSLRRVSRAPGASCVRRAISVESMEGHRMISITIRAGKL